MELLRYTLTYKVYIEIPRNNTKMHIYIFCCKTIAMKVVREQTAWEFSIPDYSSKTEKNGTLLLLGYKSELDLFHNRSIKDNGL